MKTWKLKNRLKESESDEILVYLKNFETGEEATVNLLDYENCKNFIIGCTSKFNIKLKRTGDYRIRVDAVEEKELSEIWLTHLSDGVLENFFNTLTRVIESIYFPTPLLSLVYNPYFLDFFYLMMFNDENLFEYYSHLKKEDTSNTKGGLSLLKYVKFSVFHHKLPTLEDYKKSYLGYFESKKDFLNFYISNLSSFISPFSNIRIPDILWNKYDLGRYIFKTLNLEKLTPSEFKRLNISLKDANESINFIGDYEDYEDFENKKEFIAFLKVYGTFADIMTEPSLYKNNNIYGELDNLGDREEGFYSQIATSFLNKYGISRLHNFNKFLDLNKLETLNSAQIDSCLQEFRVRDIDNFYFK